MNHPFRKHHLAAVLLLLLTISVVFFLSGKEPPTSGSTAESNPGDPATPTSSFSRPASIPSTINHRANHPPVTLRMSGGTELVLAMDEARVLHPDGREDFIILDPPATPATLRDRLAAAKADPVAYAPGVGRSPATRQVITRDLSLHPGDAAVGPLLKAHSLKIKERPDYAPGWLIVSAADPLAALAAVQSVRHTQGVLEADVLIARQRIKRALPNDPLISQQWHLFNTNTTRTHANVEPVWNFPNATGIRGTGIRIGVVDDGIQLNHPDFAGNLDTTNDRDFIQSDDDPSPIPAQEDFHGTACAGVAGARGNNSTGVSGVAPFATLVGLRLISTNSISDSQEAAAMGWKNDIIQVKSNSWGPNDDGSTLISERPGNLFLSALATATSTGRGGKGTIFVWAGGNGGTGDNSNYDGYANSIHTIAVSASNSVGTRSSYSEPGANIVVCAPSDGTTSQLAITTTDLTGTNGYNTASGTAGDYANDFGGTSSATPVVSGTVALMLEKNPNLGWRDVQEILIRSAHKIAPTDSGWTTNSAGLQFNHQFGAGLVDATAAVNLATSWTNLAPQSVVTSTQSGLPVSIPDSNATGITRTFNITDNLRVEHATVRLSASHSNHRQLDITLTSPSGMVSQLAVFGSGKSGEALTNWTFSSIRHWGESSTGTWTLKIADRASGTTGSLTAAELQLFGTPATPANQPPQITAASLSETTNGYSDTPLTVSSVTATDPESDPISYTYQWQSSTDGITFTNSADATSSLAPDPSRAAKLWRCVITASDGNSNSQPFTTAAVNLLTRPPATAAPGDALSYTSGLVLSGSDAGITRPAILNEFSQGPSGGSSEWVEILTLRSGSLRYWDLSESNQDMLVFADAAVWDNIPAGTLIVIYNGVTTKDSRIPADDTDPSDGLMVLSSTNSTYFDNTFDSWIALGNSGDFIKLSDEDSNRIHGLSYGSNTAESPNIGRVDSATSAFFNSDKEANADLASGWTTITQASSTPGSGNNAANTAFVTALRNGSLNSPALFRLGSGSTLPAGLSLDPVTGLLSGTLPINTTPGNYPITIERYNSTPTVVSQSFTLTITPIPSKPTVTINQADNQADPTTASPIEFTVVFSEPVTGFATGDVTLGGTAGPTTADVTGSGTTYTVAVNGMTDEGTVTASIAADVVDGGNEASTSTDNEVTYNVPKPTVTINQADDQADPTTASPIEFTVVFSEPVTGFDGSDITLGGSASPTTAEVTGSGTNYTVAVNGMTDEGTVTASIAADVVDGGNEASTSTDNEVSYTLPVTGFALWQQLNATEGGLDADHDGDGVTNGIEYFLGGGTDTSGQTALPAVDNTAGVLSITWTKAADYVGLYGTHFHVETSDTLAGPWSAAPQPGANISITGNQITYTFSAPLGARKFVRLAVTGP